MERFSYVPLMAFLLLPVCASAEPIKVVPVGKYSACSNRFSGYELDLMPHGVATLKLYGDDGPWEVQLAGTYSFQEERLETEFDNASYMNEHGPRVSGTLLLSWRVSRIDSSVVLELDNEQDLPFPIYWRGLNHYFSSSRHPC